MTNIPNRLLEILGAVVEAYDTQEANSRTAIYFGQDFGQGFVQPWPVDGPEATRDDFDHLRHFGLIEIDYTASGDYEIRPSYDGRETLTRWRRQLAQLENSEPIDLSWSNVRPVVHAVVDAWLEAGAPTEGFVRISALRPRLPDTAPSESALSRIADVLDEMDWLEVTHDEDGDQFARPTRRAVAATQGWPGGDAEAAAERLLSALDELATNAPEPETRGWAARMRDGMMELGVKTLAEVVSKSVGNAV